MSRLKLTTFVDYSRSARTTELWIDPSRVVAVYSAQASDADASAWGTRLVTDGGDLFVTQPLDEVLLALGWSRTCDGCDAPMEPALTLCDRCVPLAQEGS